MVMNKKILYGHRGASALQPENTLESFRQALADGATALELDVHCTKDGVIVVAHDDDGQRMANKNVRIQDATFEEIKHWNVGANFRSDGLDRHFINHPFRMPTLIQVLEAFPRIPIVVEIKPNSLRCVLMLIDLLRHTPNAARVTLASKHQRVMNAVRELQYDGPTAFCQNELWKIYALPFQYLLSMRNLSSAVLVPTHVGPFRCDTSRFIDKCHALGWRVDFWTVDNVDEAKKLLALGADGIMSNHPARVLPAFGKAFT